MKSLEGIWEQIQAWPFLTASVGADGAPHILRRSMRRRFRRSIRAAPLAWALPLLTLAGCGVERTLQVESDPQGALVHLNGEEAGRTPMRKTFLWYGTYDVQLRKEGYATRSTKAKVWAPWWQIPPVDFFAELLPFRLRDKHRVSYRLQPRTATQTTPEQVIERGVEMRRRLGTGESRRRKGAKG